MGFLDRLQHGWNAFIGRDPTRTYREDYGSGYSRRPDRVRVRYYNDKSLVTSIYNRIARMNLEHQYSRLKADEVSAGYMFLQDALDIMGSTLGVIGSTIVIAGAVNKILKAGG